MTFLEGRCLSFGSAIPFQPLGDLLRGNCALDEGDAAEVMRMKLAPRRRDRPRPARPRPLPAPPPRRVHRPPTPPTSHPRLSAPHLRGAPPDDLARASRRPHILVIEDLHWVDRTTEEFLAILADNLGAEPILLLATYCPGYQPPWAEGSYATQLSVPRLAPEDSRDLVRALLSPAPSRIRRRSSSDGARATRSFSRSSREPSVGPADGRSRPVPETVEGLLMARIDRLGDEARRVLQIGSVLGREFAGPPGLVWDGGDLDTHLLELGDWSSSRGSATAEEPRYTFKHALIQEVAYESLLSSARRRTVHAAAAQALESLYRGRLEQVADRLAHHWYRAEEPEQAVQALSRFAEQAAGAYAHLEAADALRRALSLVERLPADTRALRRTESVLALARSLYFMGRFAESLALLSEHASEVGGCSGRAGS